MSNESDSRAITQLLKQAITSLELAMELMDEAKARQPKKPSFILTKIAKRKLAQLRQAEIEAQQAQHE